MKYEKEGCDLSFEKSPLLDLNLFKKIDEDGERNYLVYFGVRKGIIYYIGEGYKDRPNTHRKDMLSNTIDSSWQLVIVADNLTKKMACILEAKLLRMVTNRTFSKRGCYEGDGISLINKQREYKYQGVEFNTLFEEYLNLDGNNYWEALRRQINRY